MAAPDVETPTAIPSLEEEVERPPHVPLPPLDPELLAMPAEEFWVSDLRWIVPGQLCVVRAPRNREHTDALARENVAHLVTLSPDAMPKPEDFPKKIKSTVIPVEEFDMPTDEAVDEFIALCEKAIAKKEVSSRRVRERVQKAVHSGPEERCWRLDLYGLALNSRVVK